VVVSDRASWAAAVTGRLRDPDPVMAGAFLSLGYPFGGSTSFRGIRALSGDRAVRAAGRPPGGDQRSGRGRSPAGADPAGGAVRVAEATGRVRPAAGRGPPRRVQLSLTGGKDSRLVAAALTAAGVPFTARTHGFASHPDVIVAGLVARHLGVEHAVTEPAAPGSPDEADVLARLRATVLVSDGMLSAFENVGRPDPPPAGGRLEAGGHGGELLRGGYAQAAWRTPAPLGAAAAAELFRRMTTRRLGLLRPEAARAYLASLAPGGGRRWPAGRWPRWTASTWPTGRAAGRPRPGRRTCSGPRWPSPCSRIPSCEPARAIRLRYRMDDRLHRDVLGLLCPGLLGIPLAGTPWQGEPAHPGHRADRRRADRRPADRRPADRPAAGRARGLAAGLRRDRSRLPARLRPWTTARPARCSAS